jgi:class 3 adenylate cyclase
MRVERSFAFLDLCGFTSFTATEGDDKATSVLAGFRSCVRDIASRRGVRVAKWLGDGAMVVAVEPEPLVAAVIEVERKVVEGHSPLPIRGGLAKGAVILFEGDDYIGTPVNLAARLCDAAGPRQVLAVPAFESFCPPWVAFGERYRVAIHGFREPVELSRLSPRPPGAAAVTDPVCGLVLDPEWALVRGDADGTSQSFCSESCAAAWSDTHQVVGRAEP